ncbi:hypothetical protein SAMN05421747_102118 [Parapedobacter composti]|uniref:Uncharacterized protein n=1 Tax=Parapedobacter composti TaxID=623281 RepID=A0A1I1EYL4_9SPHI|nr:hypothetical protein [Parapedobacter composti]SFB92164.1 hypothetical protein SAMN05421747_102118 [Parapedobacter composti]
MKKPIFLAAMSVILPAMFSCNKENLGEVSDETIHLSLFEEISETGDRNLQFRLRTAKICVNFPLDMSVTFENGGMQSVIRGVNEVDMCLTALGPAGGVIYWQQPANGALADDLSGKQKAAPTGEPLFVYL